MHPPRASWAGGARLRAGSASLCTDFPFLPGWALSSGPGSLPPPLASHPGWGGGAGSLQLRTFLTHSSGERAQLLAWQTMEAPRPCSPCPHSPCPPCARGLVPVPVLLEFPERAASKLIDLHECSLFKDYTQSDIHKNQHCLYKLIQGITQASQLSQF